MTAIKTAKISLKIIDWHFGEEARHYHQADPASHIEQAMRILCDHTEEFAPSIVWSEESGSWQVKLDGAQMQYCAKDDLALGICRAIVAAKRL